MNKEEIAKYIYDYAVEHYNDGGWDVIVECWTINDIMERIEDGQSKEDALKSFESVVDVWAERQSDAVNSAW
jgi:predicted RNase H-like HicB family nuclease